MLVVLGGVTMADNSCEVTWGLFRLSIKLNNSEVAVLVFQQ